MTRAASRSGRALRTEPLPARSPRPRATATRPTPTRAARRGRAPPMASTGGDPEGDLRVVGGVGQPAQRPVGVGVDVAATAAYRAPSTARRSRSTAVRAPAAATPGPGPARRPASVPVRWSVRSWALRSRGTMRRVPPGRRDFRGSPAGAPRVIRRRTSWTTLAARAGGARPGDGGAAPWTAPGPR
ncbi:hypothetical protein LV779_01745 [Streptomyces thinghirensis]|nr:hypothetical protein [Streptomyces thinghirensis]